MGRKIYTIKEVCDSLGLPSTVEYSNSENISIEQILYSIPQLVTIELARKLWLEWNPDITERIENETFLQAFRDLLVDGVMLGYKLSRFKEISKKLPEPTESGRSWIPFFEDVITDCNIRVCLSREDYSNWKVESVSEIIGHQTWNERMDKLTDELYYKLGLICPPVNFIIDDTISAPYFRIVWNDLKLPLEKGLAGGEILVNDSVDRLNLLGIKGKTVINPDSGSTISIVDASFKASCENSGLMTWNPAEYMMLFLSSKLRRNGGAFVNRLFVELLLFQLKPAFPETVTLINKEFKKDILVQIIRGLLTEEISIRNLYFILDTLLSIQSFCQVDSSKYIVFSCDVSKTVTHSKKLNIENLSVKLYVEAVRMELKRQVTYKFSQGQGTLIVYLLDPEIEKRLMDDKKLDDAEATDLIAAASVELGNLPPSSQKPVILTSSEIRYRMKKEIQHEFPFIEVVAYQELSPEINIQPIARISLS